MPDDPEVAASSAATPDGAETTVAPETGAPAAEAPSSSSDANAAQSSSADVKDAKAGPEAAEGPKSVLDAVAKALAPDSKPDAATDAAGDSSKPKDGQDSKPSEGEAEAKADEAEDDSKLPFHNHPRWKAVLAERDNLKAPAEQYERIQQFMDRNGLLGNEVVEGFKVMALMKNDPAKAVVFFETKIAELREFLGDKLPEDLQAEVDSGTISEERAKELSRARATNRHLASTVEQTDEERRGEHVAAVKREVSDAIVGWETTVKGKDLDYAKKQRRVMDRVRVIAQEEGGPRNKAEAIALADRAYKEVNEELTALLPRRPTVPPNPANGIPSARTVAAPKTMLEAVQAGLNAA